MKRIFKNMHPLLRNVTTVQKMYLCFWSVNLNNQLFQRVRYDMEAGHEYISEYYAWNIVC
jgi:hypothetical protein